MLTVEEAKKELKEYIFDLEYLEARQEDSERIRTLIEGVTKRLTGLPSGKGANLDKDALAEGIDRLDEIKKDSDKKIIELLVKKFVVESKIERLEQPYKVILFSKYICGNELTDISKKIGYGYKYVCDLHGVALKKYAEL